MPRDLENGRDVGLQRAGVRGKLAERLGIGLDVLEPAHLHLLGREARRNDALGERRPGVLRDAEGGAAVLFGHVEDIHFLIQPLLLGLRQKVRAVPGPHRGGAAAQTAVDDHHAGRFMRIGVGDTLEVLRLDGRIGKADGDESNLALLRRLALRVARQDLF